MILTLSDDAPHTYLGGLSRYRVGLYHDHILSWVKTSGVNVLGSKRLKAAHIKIETKQFVVFLY